MKGKIITTIIFAVLLFLTFSIRSYAFTETTPFTDVSPDDNYFSAVETLFCKGIIKGCENAIFDPERSLTVAEQNVMLHRAFGDGTAQWNEQKAGEKTSAGMFYTRLFNAAGFQLCPLEWESEVTEDQMVKAAQGLSIISLYDDSTSRPVTRGEAAIAINTVLAYTGPRDMTELRDKITYYFNDTIVPRASKRTFNVTLLFLSRLPEHIIDQFSERNYTLWLGFGKIFDYNEQHSSHAAGYIDYKNKEICITHNSRDIIHEFGHFYNKYMADDYRVANNHFDEYERLRPIIGEYAGSNQAEYFAECFEFWFCSAYHNPALLKEALEAAPETFSWFQQLEDANWPMNPIDDMSDGSDS